MAAKAGDNRKAERQRCAVEGCEKPSKGRGFCNAHFQRWFKYGDALAGGPSRATRGETQAFLAMAMIYDGTECLIWPYTRDGGGYAQITRDGVKAGVHCIVCEDVYGPPPTPDHETAHGCGRGKHGCIAKRHLRWATRAENHADKIIHGTTNRGERQGSSKLKTADVIEIRRLRGTVMGKDLAERFGVSKSCICSIQLNANWGWLSA